MNIITLTNLKIDMEFRSLSALGKFIDSPLPSGGKGRIDCLNEWKRYFEWEKIDRNKHTILITNMLVKPVVKDISIGSRSIYIKHIEIILMQLLAKTKGGSMDITKNALWYDLGFCNEKYNNYESEREFLHYNHDIDVGMINQFKSREYKKFNEILIAALTSLSNRRVIDWCIDTIITDVDGNIFKASDAQKDIIRDVEYEVLQEFGYKIINQIWLNGRQQDFYERVYKTLKHEFGWVHKTKVVHILYTDKVILKTLEEDMIQLERLALNQLLHQASDKQAITQYNNYLKKLNRNSENLDKLIADNCPNGSKTFYTNFIEIQQRLSKEFIKFINS